MTNADWWARVVQARTERDDVRPQRVWTLHKGWARRRDRHLKAVPGIDAAIVLAVDGAWRKTRLFRSHEQAGLVGAIAETRAVFQRGTSQLRYVPSRYRPKIRRGRVCHTESGVAMLTHPHAPQP